MSGAVAVVWSQAGSRGSSMMHRLCKGAHASMIGCGSCTSHVQSLLPGQMTTECAQSSIAQHLSMQRAHGVQGCSVQRTQPGERAESSVCCDQQRLHRPAVSALGAARASWAACLSHVCMLHVSSSPAKAMLLPTGQGFSLSHACITYTCTSTQCLSERSRASHELQDWRLPGVACQLFRT